MGPFFIACQTVNNKKKNRRSERNHKSLRFCYYSYVEITGQASKYLPNLREAQELGANWLGEANGHIGEGFAPASEHRLRLTNQAKYDHVCTSSRRKNVCSHIIIARGTAKHNIEGCILVRWNDTARATGQPPTAAAYSTNYQYLQ